MNVHRWIAVGLGLALAGVTAAVAETAPAAAATGSDALVEVKSKRFDQVAVQPGADFRRYTKVMLNPTEVTFARSWIKDMNANRISLLTRTTPGDAERIARSVRTGFDDALAKALQRAGYAIVTAPGPDVLALSPRVVDLYVNAPASITMAVPSRVYTQDAGEATFAFDVQDATTGTLLARVDDRRTAGDRGNFRSSFMITNPVTNDRDFGQVLALWARDSVRTLDEFKQQSPMKL
ncbi:MAG: DUF3313 family protein [Burkholderiales bacterium]